MTTPQKFFYPVTSGMYIEDELKQNFMLALNDRSQAASTYVKGRMEFLINRYGVTSDELGLSEAMNDQTPDYMGPNITAKFWISFPKTKLEVF